ncbi:Non-reducing end alpha-L-arabinofuranosidase BoGH43A 6 [Colletotrichum truncatum]|uniref:Non-reducing end alpha-L-arabinofuranosidase BoGH43A 6 n=1 Tax=Colletotrichum truncatum TaxID=5467 RepID=A0ACC3ZCU9_COLTU|nr:Non-reducing end alpha-L-arabinofuranosidase BoGH43A 6 [Colletotrichum truncatum]KAF6797923.1 Non-reducing end alpha-L-arabinofuranosidase BoGH43A 6 [Colletotrichum truncatum]
MSKSMSFQNPILPGFYPDPSVVRVGEIFYMINSSFQIFPGLPIHRSTDLVHWELIGHAICRTTQLDLSYAVTKINRPEFGEYFTAGLYAPTIRHHDGIFYIVCTNLKGRSGMFSTEDFAPENFIITCKDLTEPTSFSDPIYFDFHGIDPSLFFDDDGKVFMQGSWIHGYRKKPATVIRQAEIDLSTGKYLSDLRDIWAGSGDKVPEGPHLYKLDGSYWLLIAEGGTHRSHKITMACSDNVWGPYESYQGNPVLTTQGPGHPIQCVGHGDLFTDANDEWWCAMLARREYGSAYPLGRETYLVPAVWPKGAFPVLEHVELEQIVDSRHCNQDLLAGQPTQAPRKVTFECPHTLFLRTPNLQTVSQGLEDNTLCLRATPAELGCADGSPTFVGRRQVSLKSSASAVLDLQSLPEDGHCGLSLYKDTYRHVSLDVNSNGQLSLALVHQNQKFAFVNSTSIVGCSSIKLIIKSTADTYNFSYELLQNECWQGEANVGTVNAADLSGDDFTGTVYGIYASGTSGTVTFKDFTIE